MDYIREIRPQVVLTFDPIGGYRHPDHIAIHNATVRGFELAGDPEFEDGMEPYKPDKLYFHFIPRGLFRFAVLVLPLFGRDPRRFGRNQDIDLVALVGEDDFPTDAAIIYKEVMAKKEEAVACHSSQLDESMASRGLIYWIMRWYERRDFYMRAYPKPDSGIREKDLFAGINVDW